MNTLFYAIIIGIMGLINYRLSKSLFYPAFIFSCYWALLLLLLVILPNDYYALTNQTLLIFTVGILCFSLGSLLCLQFFRPKSTLYIANSYIAGEAFRPYITYILTYGLIISLILLPYYCYHLYQMGQAYQSSLDQLHLNPLSNFFMALRKAVIFDKGLGIFKYLNAWFSFLCLIALVELQHRKNLKNKIIVCGFFIIVLTYYLLSTARIGMISFLFSFFCLYFMLVGKLEIKKIIAGSLLVICAFILPAVIMHKGTQLDTSTSANFLSLLKNMELYLLGSIVAFNKVVNYQDSLVELFPHLYSLSFFFKIAHAFNSNIDVPLAIFPNIHIPELTNVYTIFFSWFIDFGWVGIIILFSILGFLTTVGFHYASRKKPIALILYACAVAGLLLSSFYDAFLVGISFWLQLFVITFLIYKVPSLASSCHTRSSTLLNQGQQK